MLMTHASGETPEALDNDDTNGVVHTIPRLVALQPGSAGTHTKNLVPMMSSCVHNRCVLGTGKKPSSAVMIVYSRSTAWAPGSSFPGGCFRTTNSLPRASFSKNVCRSMCVHTIATP